MATTNTYIKIKEVETEDWHYEVFLQEENNTLHLTSYYKEDKGDGCCDVEEMPESEAIRVFGALFNVHITDDETGLCNY